MEHLNGLNPAQKEAVLATEGPVLIIAGAGAGKTKTITHRIAQLISQGVAPRSILAVTFTNKAAGEMRERVKGLVKEGHGMPLVTTFHSLGVRILREFHEEAGLPASFTIWDRDDSIRCIKRTLEDKGSSLTPRSVLSRISREKGAGVTAGEYAERAHRFPDTMIAGVWTAYDKALVEEGALDFDDLLSRTLSLLKRSERVRTLLQHRWKYLTIDEYQDTNGAQYEIARILAGEKCNICVVGDIDQNIYSWRGADIEHLMQFEDSFPGTKVITLEQNYRSTRTILKAANAVIEKNQRRKPKTLFTDNETGEPLALYCAQNELDEAWFVAAKIEELMQRGTPAAEIAVLYRENFQSRALEEALLHFGVPYRVLGTRFFERKEVKDVLCYLRAALNSKSRTDLARIVGVPARGIGKVTLDTMLTKGDDALPSAARGKVQRFRESLDRIRAALGTLPASDAVRYCVEESGLEKMYQAMGDEGRERLENIQELVNFATRYDFAQPHEGIDMLLEEAALQSDQDELEEQSSAVSLMTVHASKGLEFNAVFVTGLEQGLFPSLREGGERDPEEERRLFYVALTRAKKRLFLSYAGERMKYGSREYAIPSEFIEDIDSRLIEYARKERGDHEETIIA